MFYEDVVGDALWTMEFEAKVSGLLIARVHYAQIKGGYVVEGGGWGDRNNLEVIVSALQNTYKALGDAALHSYLDTNGIARVQWQTHMRKRYGKFHVAPQQDITGVPED